MKKQYVLILATPYYRYHGDEILFIMKDRPAFQKGRFNLIGGKIEEGESPEQAVVRELKEETGYNLHNHAKTSKKMGVLEDGDELIHCFIIQVDTYLQENPKPRPEETEIVRWYRWQEIKDDARLMPNLRLVVPLMLEGISNWKISFQDSFLNKKEYTVQVTIPSHLNESLKEKLEVTNILNKNE